MKLEPCPFCGNANPSYRESMLGQFIVCCNVCLADGPQAKTSAEAEALWNRRKAPKEWSAAP